MHLAPRAIPNQTTTDQAADRQGVRPPRMAVRSVASPPRAHVRRQSARRSERATGIRMDAPSARPQRLQPLSSTWVRLLRRMATGGISIAISSWRLWTSRNCREPPGFPSKMSGTPPRGTCSLKLTLWEPTAADSTRGGRAISPRPAVIRSFRPCSL